jgi:hypothetical protein
MIVPLLSFLASSCGNLSVQRYDPAKKPDGVTFFLPEQEFVVTDNTLDKNGNPVPAAGVRHTISLVTHADQTRVFSVKNSPAWFSDSTFSVQRTADGVVTSINGGSTGKADALVQSLVGIAASLGAGAKPAESDDLKQQLKEQEDLSKRLRQNLTTLLGASPLPVTEIESTQKTLSITLDRIAALKAQLDLLQNPPSKVEPGVSAGRAQSVHVSIAASEADAREKTKSLPGGQFEVYVVPTSQRKGGS